MTDEQPSIAEFAFAARALYAAIKQSDAELIAEGWSAAIRPALERAHGLLAALGDVAILDRKPARFPSLRDLDAADHYLGACTPNIRGGTTRVRNWISRGARL